MHVSVVATVNGEHKRQGDRRLSQREGILRLNFSYAADVSYLRAALEAKVLTSDLSPQRLRTRLKNQYERWWSIDVDHFESKKHFLRYAGRYVRRAADRAVSFGKDHGSRSPVLDQG